MQQILPWDVWGGPTLECSEGPLPGMLYRIPPRDVDRSPSWGDWGSLSRPAGGSRPGLPGGMLGVSLVADAHEGPSLFCPGVPGPFARGISLWAAPGSLRLQASGALPRPCPLTTPPTYPAS